MDATPRPKRAWTRRTGSEARAVAHRMVDDAIAYLQGVRETARAGVIRPPRRRPSRQAAAARAHAAGRGLRRADPQPDALSHGQHPSALLRLVHGRRIASPARSGEFLAAIQGSNLGGGRHAAAMMDGQVVDWLARRWSAFRKGERHAGERRLDGQPHRARRRPQREGGRRRARATASPPCPRPLRFYASDQVHSCHRKAVECLGLGDEALRRIPTDDDLRIDLAALRRAIAEDRAAGFQPACVIGTAGTVNTGAIDDLPALAEIARQEDLWFHVDGCIGALVALSPTRRRAGGRDRAGRLPRARSAQMAARPVRGRLRAGARRRGPPRAPSR